MFDSSTICHKIKKNKHDKQALEWETTQQEKEISTLIANRFKLSHSKSRLQYADRTYNTESYIVFVNSTSKRWQVRYQPK